MKGISLKKQMRTRSPDLKRSRWILSMFLGLALVGLILSAAYFFMAGTPAQPEVEVDIETYIRSKVAKEDIVPSLVPAVIYYRRLDMAKEDFCAVGTLCADQNGAPQIITSEHIFRTDIRSEQIMTVRALRGSMEPPVAYIGRIVATGKDLGGPTREERDIVIASLTLESTVIKPYSNFVHGGIAQTFWIDVVMNGKKISRLRSLVSGEYVETLGYARRGEGETGPVFIVINCHTRSGESGTGYVDDFGGLWVLHGGSSSKEMERQACAEYKKTTGRTAVGVSTVSGPLFGHYK